MQVTLFSPHPSPCITLTRCSSLNGLLEQHGPFRPDAHGNLQPNDATWTSVANM